ncbi:MAG: tetratricopeptide repeat protein [Chthoniobacteraceae bacterium]
MIGAGIPTELAQQIAIDHFKCGRVAEAETMCRRILAAQPDFADALHLLGLIASHSGHLAPAVELLRRAIALRPGAAAYHLNLGNALCAAGQSEEGIAEYRSALVIDPALAVAHNNLAAALKAMGQLDDAVAEYRRAIELEPAYAECHSNLGVALSELGRHGEAVSACERALALAPNFATAHYNLGNALIGTGRTADAIAAFSRAVQSDPEYATAFANLASALRDVGRFGEAIVHYRRALALRPGLAIAQSNLGSTLKDQGDIDAGLVHLRRAVELQPDAPALHSNLLASLHYSPRTTAADLLAAHREFDRVHAAPLRAGWSPHTNSREPERRLRLGFISPHFARHPVGHFLVRVLENLQPADFEIACYSDTDKCDEMTERLRATSAVWRETTTWNDEKLAAQIRIDAADILFDLAGQTAGHRLLVFARKPAPIQVSWLDYVGTTGLSAIDYLLADPREIPPDSEQWCAEKVLRMPDDYICFDPPPAPPVNPLPALSAGHVTFGSFNILSKTTPGVVALWSRILHRVPGARLLLKNTGLDDPGTVARYRDLFAAHGIGGERVEFLGWSPSHELLATYHRVDVALDTFPYNGGLTTCEALWMGVPVVTCPGEIFASRHGLTHLASAGFTETIARDLAGYESIAVELAGDLPRLAAIRAGLRERVASSPLCDGARFAANFAALMRDVWRQGCNRA